MKRGFTLVEMLIVVVVIVTLMTITFRLSSLGGDSEYRNRTITRLNRVENCLSGYFAAFGTYPPVQLHGSRDIYARVSAHGIQSDTDKNTSIWGWQKIGEKAEIEAWEQVRAACKAQPVDCRFPFPDSPEYNIMVKGVSDQLKKKAEGSNSGLSENQKAVLSAGFDNGVSENVGRHNSNRTENDWREIQLFKYGLMSYLLPRYLIMMNSKEELYTGSYSQWDSNNDKPCDPLTGEVMSWQRVRDFSRGTTSSDLAHVANIPSQAVTARWMPNLEGIVCCNHNFTLFGIPIRGDSWASELRPDNTDIEVFSPGGYDNSSTAGQYVLDSATVLDGWYHEMYYYSAPPYQSYTLWSGGKNNRTFPPWISRKSLESNANRCVALWIEDDIIRMKN